MVVWSDRGKGGLSRKKYSSASKTGRDACFAIANGAASICHSVAARRGAYPNWIISGIMWLGRHALFQR